MKRRYPFADVQSRLLSVKKHRVSEPHENKTKQSIQHAFLLLAGYVVSVTRKSNLVVEIPHRGRTFQLSEETHMEYFRFTMDELKTLNRFIGIPDIHRCRTRYLTSGLEMLQIVLLRLAYPTKWSIAVQFFGRSQSALCSIYYEAMEFIMPRISPLLFWDMARLTPATLQVYADSISRCCPLRSCFGFIDGTIRQSTLMDGCNEALFNGHKWMHGIKYQVITAPDGLIIHAYGPIEGRSHDSRVLTQSAIVPLLNALPLSGNGDQFVIFGDSGYPLINSIIRPYTEPAEGSPEHIFNTEMAKQRVTVEWSFHSVNQYFSVTHFLPRQRLGITPIGNEYQLSIFFTNCLTCCKGGNAIGDHFDLTPPTLQAYLHIP